MAEGKGRQSGKPADIVSKMVDGAIAKFRKENALLSQPFVIDGKTPVAEVVAAAGKDVGATITLKGFVRFQLGEGLEQEESDFADEVAGAAGRCIKRGEMTGLGRGVNWTSTAEGKR